MATRRRTIDIKPIKTRETCGNCDDFSSTAGIDGVCLFNPPVAYLDSDGGGFSLRAEVESDDPCCRQFKPVRSI